MATLPDYVSAAKPVPQHARAAWYKNTAQTYAGIMLWYVFWQQIAASDPGTLGGVLARGLWVALLGLVAAALFCHFLTYLVPGLLGMKTGLPLYVVGTSTYGVRGGLIMPGFLMGVLQFGWLAVNAFFASMLLCQAFEIGGTKEGDVFTVAIPGLVHGAVALVIIVLAVFVGLKGIQYVAKAATYVPLIPLVILVILLVKTVGGVAHFKPETMIADNRKAAEQKLQELQDDKVPAAKKEVSAAKTDEDKKKATDKLEAAQQRIKGTKALLAAENMSVLAVLLFMSTYVVGFFATAGAAGADFGMNNRDANDVHLGGLAGIVGATAFAGGLSLIIVAGAYGTVDANGMPMISADFQGELNAVTLTPSIVGPTAAKWMKFLLALSAFAPACVPAFIAANSFKTTMPKFGMTAVGIGTAASIFLAVSGWAGEVIPVFKVIGASFGPICGAMIADYLLSGRKWAGPRAAFNPAGWISWAVGFILGAIDLVADKVPGLSGIALGVPCPPMAALIAGFVLYLILAKAGLESKKLEMPRVATR